MQFIKYIRFYKNWPIFFLSYFGIIKKRQTLFRLRNGLKFWVNTQKRGFGIITDVFLSKPYHFLLNGGPETLLDLGGHIGSFSILAANNYPNSKIYAFEASPENARLFMKNLKENNISSVKIYNYGVAEKESHLNFYASKLNTGLNTFIKNEKIKTDRILKVKCVDLNYIFEKICDEKCVCLKIDVEGMEYKIFKKLKKKHFEKIKKMAIEVEKDTVLQIKKLLISNNFFVCRKGNILYASRDN